METQIIEIFCIISDVLKNIGYKDDRQVKISTAEIMTIVITAAQEFGGNHEKSRKYFHEQNLVKAILHKGQFNRRIHAIPQTIWKFIREKLALIFKNRNVTQEYTIDSFPVPVCKNIRINRCNIYQEEIYRGLISSKKEYFFGIRAHMICTVNREPMEIIFAPGAVSDAKIFQEFEFDLPSGSKLYGDKMYNNYKVEDRLKSSSDINVLPIRKSNLKRQHTSELTRDIKKKRKSIETTFSQITNLFPKNIHAVTSHGFELKVFSFILAYSFMML